MSDDKTKDEVYRERNLLAVSLATRVYNGGGYAGWHRPEPGEWPVVWVRLPIPGDRTVDRQVGHHVNPQDESLLVRSRLPEQSPPGGYDGHTRDDRLERMIDYIEYDL